jgi:Tfp pilus assembly protein PilX
MRSQGILHRCPAAQRGAVLFIALIALAAMAIAAVGLIRSLGTALNVSGNLAFRAAALQAAGRGVEKGYQWLLAQAGTPTLNTTNAATGYFSSAPGTEPDWSAAATWTSAVVANDASGNSTDSAGNKVSYIINRMCTEPNTAFNGVGATGVANQCAMYFPSTAGNTGSSMASGSFTFQGNPQIYYRISVLVTGPRGTTAVTQAMVLISN